MYKKILNKYIIFLNTNILFSIKSFAATNFDMMCNLVPIPITNKNKQFVLFKIALKLINIAGTINKAMPSCNYIVFIIV